MHVLVGRDNHCRGQLALAPDVDGGFHAAELHTACRLGQGRGQLRQREGPAAGKQLHITAPLDVGGEQGDPGQIAQEFRVVSRRK